jgi:hypothetical protein
MRSLHLQLHGLPDLVRQRFCAQHAGRDQRFSHRAGRAERLAAHLAVGAEVTSWFCGDCGARLYGERQGRPDTMNVRAGTLDDTEWLTPIAHMFTSSAQAWVAPALRAECHDTMPSDYQALGAKWRELWPQFFPQK